MSHVARADQEVQNLWTMLRINIPMKICAHQRIKQLI